jgi:predicted 3-demethylubiquinone-9 3-methyltransferase (glyoxalase superfamily)
MGELLSDQDKVKVKRVMDAFLKMKKIVIKDLEKAYEG